jgi:hypothetical protein
MTEELGQEAKKAMSDEEFWKVLGEMPYCFCLECKHQESYGPCAKCRCGNKSWEKKQ